MPSAIAESYGASRSRSVPDSSTWKSLGTRRRSRERIWALLSHSRCRAAEISTGCTAERNALAKAPEISCSRRCSNLDSPLTAPPPSRSSEHGGRDRTGPMAGHRYRRSPDATDRNGAPDSTGASPAVRCGRRPGSRAARFGNVRAAGIALPRFEREWRNRQTRTVQVRVSERTWGFNSPLAHKQEAGRPPGPGDRATRRLVARSSSLWGRADSGHRHHRAAARPGRR